MRLQSQCPPTKPGIARGATRTTRRLVPCAGNNTKVSEVLRPLGLAISTVALTAGVSHAEYTLPPLDLSDPNRCNAVFEAQTSGKQATRSGQVTTAVSGKVLDARQCNLQSAKLPSKILSGSLFDDTNFSGADLRDARLSKSIIRNADFRNVDFSNGVVDRIDFTNTNLNGSNFYNAIVTNTNFQGADLGGTNFEYALFGKEDIKKVCQNPTLQDESREQVGCPN
ncbi:hypothetical protein DUNSADRAFT_13198 [Dunaliella salina]|uniref:Thylakoid lumenal 17.4 kDa protein, chloroplastic n=1 Tax=Dunaliella salina TaxID=3046 RepID=A0ABQ7G9V5_DUNSA|nr:hypothetical protein DUNSADRAFT_13198 [Dunaliella salina]|eukprot:KAF5831382.1 hypothetical protein DUNSADRAFT_13198 [Dunaliella salina]